MSYNPPDDYDPNDPERNGFDPDDHYDRARYDRDWDE